MVKQSRLQLKEAVVYLDPAKRQGFKYRTGQLADGS